MESSLFFGALCGKYERKCYLYACNNYFLVNVKFGCAFLHQNDKCINFILIYKKKKKKKNQY